LHAILPPLYAFAVTDVPVANDSNQARALVQLRDLILKGEFAPGERLAEIPLAARLGMSRTPVRVALASLEREGLVSPSSSGGYTMRKFTPQEIQDAIDVRGHLEGMAARLLAERGAPRALLASLQDCIRAGDQLFEPAGHELDYAANTEMNNRFHELVVQGCGNAALARAVEINNRLPFAPASAAPLRPGPVGSAAAHPWPDAAAPRDYARGRASVSRPSGRFEVLTDRSVAAYQGHG
jgi:DNA-binding GntR family transcriptional regulator